MTVPRRAWAWAALTLLAPASAFADSANLIDMVDDLQRIQLQIAQGDKAAYTAQLNQLKMIGAAIAAARPETWKDRRQADSLVICEPSPTRPGPTVRPSAPSKPA